MKALLLVSTLAGLALLGCRNAPECDPPHPKAPNAGAPESVAVIPNPDEIDASQLSPFEDPATGLYGYSDAYGVILLPAIYPMAFEFNEHGLAAVVLNQRWVYIDKRGREIIHPVIYDNGPDPFQDGLARFEGDAKIGYFNEKGEIVIPPTFDYAFPFAEGRAVVCQGCTVEMMDEYAIHKGGRWGYIDTSGQVVIPLDYAFANDFMDGRAAVTHLDGRASDIDRDGKILE